MHSQRYPTRLGIVFFTIFFLLGLFSCQLFLIQIFRSDFLSGKADRQHNRIVELEARRGTIYDRDLRVLALNVAAYSLYANPRVMTPQQKTVAMQKVSAILNLDAGALMKKVSKPKGFVWLARKVSSEQYTKLKELKLHGLGFSRESKRFYPNGHLAAHMIGFADIDNVGLQGVEKEYDRFLRGTPGAAQFLRDARQRDLMIEKDVVAPIDGHDIVLTIDETIQFITENALDKIYKKHAAADASIIVLDPKTGEVLAFATRPTFRPDAPGDSPAGHRTNRAVAFVYEPGSVFKIVTAAAALEEGVTREEDVIFCENGKYRVANHILKDTHPKGNLTFQQVIEQSSNIGTVKIAQRLGPDKIYEYAQRFRFGVPTRIGMEGEVAGTLKPPHRWSKTSIGAIPIGQEVTVTAVQLVQAVAAIANDGVMMKPHIIKYVKESEGPIVEEHRPEVVGRVMTAETAFRLRRILQGVIDHGTATQAKCQGIDAAGKTGTAQKVVDGRYSHSSFVASFIGFAPTEDAQLAIVISVDEPHHGYYGGTVTGPAFREIVENSLKYLASKKK